MGSLGATGPPGTERVTVREAVVGGDRTKPAASTSRIHGRLVGARVLEDPGRAAAHLPPEIDEEQLATVTQRSANRGEHFRGTIEVVVDVAQNATSTIWAGRPMPVSVPATLMTFVRFSRAARSAMYRLNRSTTSSA